MWEFSIGVDSENVKVCKFLYKSLKKFVEEAGGVITSYDEAGRAYVVIACEDMERPRLEYYVKAYITEAICSYFKSDFISQNLTMPSKAFSTAFKSALLNFDKETDRYIIGKALTLEKNLLLESFFNFKLQSLKAKWTELVKIVGDNAVYLLNEETLIELLRFLVDNLEILQDSVNIVEEDGEPKLLDENFKEIVLESEEVRGENWLLGAIISLSPRKINVYGVEGKEINLIERIYDDRLNLLSSTKFLEKFVDTKSK